MDAFDDIAYSDAGHAGRDIFLAEFSDVLFYFEDADYEPVYEKLISIIAPEYLTDSVVCLGGKSNMIKEVRSANTLGKPRIFIVDKDFDDLLALKIDEEGLIYSDRFCIESYLLCFSSILGVAVDRHALGITAAHRQCQDFESFHSQMLLRYEELTRLFLVARRNRLPIRTTKMPVEDLLHGDHVSDILPQQLVDEFQSSLLSVAEREGSWIVAGEVLDALKVRAFGDEETPLIISQNLCGKHLFWLILKYIDSSVGSALAQLSPASLYMDVMGRIADLTQRFRVVRSLIDDSVERQRRLLRT